MERICEGADLGEVDAQGLILGKALYDGTTQWPAGYTP